jgi:hypothetical protein
MKFIFTIIFFIAANNSFPQIIDDWQTYFEKSNYQKTPPYQETIDYFNRLADYSEYAKLFKIGVSPQGRELKCFIVSKDKAFTPLQARETGCINS